MSSPGSILVVDDDPALLEAVETTLTPAYRVFTALKGAQAMQIVEQQVLDLALIDYLLPDASGLQLLREIRRISPSLPIVLMTGFGSEDVAIESFRSGVRDYLKKPFSALELLTRVEEVLVAPPGMERAPLGPQGATEARGWPEMPRLPNRSLQRAIVFVERNLNASVSLDQVAREAGMSKFHFCRVFKGVTGLTFREFLARRRIARAVELLQDRDRSLTDVSLDVGFKDVSHFGRVFRKLTGHSPSRFRRTAAEPEWGGKEGVAQEKQE